MRFEIHQIAKEIEARGGDMFLVGGAIRDEIMGVEPQDLDFMVSGIEQDAAMSICRRFGEIVVEDATREAPVFILVIGDEKFEIAMARIDVDTKPGKHGFEFISNPSISPLEDARRRDFTIGAMRQRITTGRIFDPFDGRSDIEAGVIRAVDPETFVKSPERMWRGACFSARKDWDVDPQTIILMRGMKQHAHMVPVEQVWRFVEKAAKEAIAPDRFLAVLSKSQWIEFFPEIKEWEASHALFDLRDSQDRGFISPFLAALIAGMSFNEEKSFFDKICAPKRFRGLARDIKEFGPDGRPSRWVEGRDIAHVIEPGPSMGSAVKWAWIGQINGIFADKQEAIAWVEQQKDNF